MIYHAQKTVALCDLLPLSGAPVSVLYGAVGRNMLFAGEWVFLPEGREKYVRLSYEKIQGLLPEEYDRIASENGLIFLYEGCFIREKE